MSEIATRPVQVLREHVTELEAALSVCLADPSFRPVHRLRTGTRRVEAQLLLIEQMPELPEHRKRGKRLHRALKRLRRAAAEVRDLDVQRKRLEEIAERPALLDLPAVPSAEEGTTARKRRKGAAAPPPAEGAEAGAGTDLTASLAEGATALRDHLHGQRDAAVDRLQSLLRKRQSKTARAIEALLDQLQPGEALELPEGVLLQHAQSVFGRDHLLTGEPDEVTELDSEELHGLRKAAKAARYLAESLPGSPEAVRVAAHFEALQQAGGEWHDALDLARAARRHLGRKHGLTLAVAAGRDLALGRFRELLEAESRRVAQAAEPKSRAAADESKRRPGKSKPASGTAPRKAVRKPVVAARGQARRGARSAA